MHASFISRHCLKLLRAPLVSLYTIIRNSFPASPNLNHTPLKDLKIKNSIKILGVYFTFNLFINHILLVGKQYIYNCRCTKTNPCLRVFLARLNNVYQLETIIAKSKNKMSFHLSKWQALLTGGTQLPTNTC